MPRAEKPRRGRPPGTGKPLKPEGEHFVSVRIWMPPALARMLRELIPARARSAWVAGVLARALKREAGKREGGE